MPALQRRLLRFDSIEQALAEVDRLIVAEREGRLDRAGNWTLGQTLGHLAVWMNFAFDGYPSSVYPPALLRVLVKLFKGRILSKGMLPGMKVGKVPGGTLGTEVLTTDEGVARLIASFERLRTTPPTLINPVFGPLTHEQWIQLNLRHAELHLGFLLPRPA